ncbi:MAG: phage holin family protein [Lachnospiraceae bacterium]|nr:phage holin family protein [Lachnospiraceae bacterium]
MKRDATMILFALTFNMTDIISGLLVALKNKKIVSSKLRDGLFKKSGFILCYFMGFMIDNFGIQVGLELGVRILPVLVLYSTITEIVSILENVTELNPSLTKMKLMQLFKLGEENEQNRKNA